MVSQIDTASKMHSDKEQRKFSLTLEVSCYKNLKKQSGMCAAHAEVIIITHIKLLRDNLREKNPHFRFLDSSLFTLPCQFFPNALRRAALNSV